MATLNRVQLIGNVGKDPDSNYTQSGQMVSKFSLAVNSSWKTKDGEKKENTEWVNLEAWGKLAEIISKNVKKGSSIYVEGRLKTDKYEDSGETKYFTKVVLTTVQFLGGKNNQPQVELPDPDDIPF